MYGKEVPEPEAIHCTKWHNNPLALGAYHCLRYGCTHSDLENLSRPVNSLHFAGRSFNILYSFSICSATMHNFICTALSFSVFRNVVIISTQTSNEHKTYLLLQAMGPVSNILDVFTLPTTRVFSRLSRCLRRCVLRPLRASLIDPPIEHLLYSNNPIDSITIISFEYISDSFV